MAYPDSVLASTPPAMRQPVVPPKKPKVSIKPSGPDYSSLLASVPQIDPAAILAQARGAATADTSALTAALRAQQGQILGQSTQQAGQINQAGTAAADYLKQFDFGGNAEAGIRQSAGDLASLASGFSGQLRDTAGAEAAKIQQGLASIGAPGAPTSTAAQAGNVVYGLGGQIPASALLQSAPAIGAAARAIPAQALGQASEAAIGTLGAGRQEAAKLNTDIATAVGGQSKLTRDYATQFTSAAEKSRQDQVGNVFKAIAADQKDAATQATAAYRQGLLAERAATRTQTAADKAADRKATVAYKASYLKHLQAGDDEQAAHNAAMEEAAAARIDAMNARTKATIDAAARKESLPNASLSAKTGVLVDSSGVPVTAEDGKPIVLPGFKVDKSGNVVKVASAGKPAGPKIIGTDKTGRFRYDPATGKMTRLPGVLGKPVPGTAKTNGLTASKRADLRKQAVAKAHIYYWGKTVKTNGEIDKDLSTPGLKYGVALNRLEKEFTLSRNEAMAILNDYYAPGEYGRPTATQAGAQAKAARGETVWGLSAKPRRNPGTIVGPTGGGNFPAGR